MQVRTLLAAFCFLGLTLAGCAGDKAAPAAGASPKTDSKSGADGIGARILGRVVDSELFPLTDVRVFVFQSLDSASSIELRTDETGGFTVGGLAPGQYAVSAVKPGYTSGSTSVTIAEGEEKIVRLVLEEIPAVVAFHSSVNRRTLMNEVCTPPLVINPFCWGLGLTDNRNLLNPADTTPYSSSYDHPNNETTFIPLETLVVEAFWRENPSACKVGMKIEFFSPDVVKPSFIQNQRSDSDANRQFHWTNVPPHAMYWAAQPSNMTTPIHMRVNRTGEEASAMHSPARTNLNGGKPIETAGLWHFSYVAFPGKNLGTPILDVSCGLDVKADLWFSWWYLEPAPSDWTIQTTG